MKMTLSITNNASSFSLSFLFLTETLDVAKGIVKANLEVIPCSYQPVGEGSVTKNPTASHGPSPGDHRWHWALSSLWSGLGGDQRWNEALCSLSRTCQSGRSVLVTHTNMFKCKIRVYWVTLEHGVWVLQCGSPGARGSGRSGQRAPGQGWIPSPLTRASFEAMERFCVSQPSFHFYTLWGSCCWKGFVTLQRASSGGHSVG